MIRNARIVDMFWPPLLVFAGLVVGFFVGLIVADIDAEAESPTAFTARVAAEIPALADADPTDLLAYGGAVCAGAADGWTRAELVDWINIEPADYLGHKPGGAFVDLATTHLCSPLETS